METAEEGKGEKKGGKNPKLYINRTVLTLLGVSRTHQGEGKAEALEFIVLGISPLIFLQANGYIKIKPNLFSNIIISLAEIFLTNLKPKRLFRSP